MSGSSSVAIEDQSPEYEQKGSNCSQDYRLGKLYSLYKRYFETVVVICGWDLFAVYKREYADRRTKYHRSLMLPELRLGQNNFDKWRKRLRIPVLTLIGYLIARLLIVGLVKVTDAVLLDVYVFNSTRLQSLSISAQAQLNAFLSPSLARCIMPAYYQTLIEQVMKQGQSIKEPYDSIAIATDLLELLITVCVFFYFFIVPRTHEKDPLNATIQRFMLDPLREISRIDLVIKHHIDMLLLESSTSFAVRDQLKQVASLRPHIFSAERFHSLYRVSLTTTLLVFTEVTSALLAFYYALYRIVERNLCIINGIENCHYWSVFAISDTLYMGEIVAIVGAGSLIFSLLSMVLAFTDTIAQLAMVRATRDELTRCLFMLKTSNLLSEDLYSLVYGRDYRSSSRRRASLGLRPVDSRRLLKNSSREQEIELCLLRTYLKLVVTLDEVRQIAHFVGHMVEINLMCIGYVLFTLFINFVYNDFKIPPTQLFLFVNCFILSNPFMLIGSFAFARTVELERVAWSILAELTIYQELAQRKGNPRSCKSSEHIEVLARRWRKLVRSYALSSQRNASQPFGLSMTYGQVINIDFFVISIGFVLMTH